MATKRRTSKWASDAALQAIVRFGPELSGLKELARQAQEQRNTTIAQAHGSAASMMGAIDQARPEVAAIYDKAGLDQARAASSVAATDLSGLGASANAFKAAAAIETGTAGRHIAEARAANLSDLSNRRVQTRAGEQFAVQGAQQKFASDLAKVLARKQDLSQEKGAFEASTINSLEQSALGRQLSARNSQRSASQSERNSVRSSGIDPDTGKPIPGGKLDPKVNAKTTLPGGVKLNTAAMHGTVADQVTTLEGWIREHRDLYKSRAEIARDLLNGVPGSTVADPKTGAKLRDPGVPKAPSALALSAALDVVYNGGISNGTARRLHARGYSVQKLGLPAGTKVKPAPKRSRRAAALIPASR